MEMDVLPAALDFIKRQQNRENYYHYANTLAL
jgi:hypothetical protein